MYKFQCFIFLFFKFEILFFFTIGGFLCSSSPLSSSLLPFLSQSFILPPIMKSSRSTLHAGLFQNKTKKSSNNKFQLKRHVVRKKSRTSSLTVDGCSSSRSESSFSLRRSKKEPLSMLLSTFSRLRSELPAMVILVSISFCSWLHTLKNLTTPLLFCFCLLNNKLVEKGYDCPKNTEKLPYVIL